MRLFKLKAFARFQRREGVADKTLSGAIAADELMEFSYGEDE